MKKEKKKIRYMPSGVLKKFVFVFAALYLGIQIPMPLIHRVL